MSGPYGGRSGSRSGFTAPERSGGRLRAPEDRSGDNANAIVSRRAPDWTSGPAERAAARGGSLQALLTLAPDLASFWTGLFQKAGAAWPTPPSGTGQAPTRFPGKGHSTIAYDARRILLVGPPSQLAVARQWLHVEGMTTDTIASLSAAFEAVRLEPSRWRLALVAAPPEEDLEDLVDMLLRLRADVRALPVVLAIGGTSRDDFSTARLPLADATLRLPLSSRTLRLALAAAPENNVCWIERGGQNANVPIRAALQSTLSPVVV